MRLSKSKKIILLISAGALAGILYFSVTLAIVYLLVVSCLFAFNEYVVNVSKTSMIFRSNPARNFDTLVFGSTGAWQFFKDKKFDKTKVLLFTFFKRSILADYLILQHKFSYLKSGGKVVLTIDRNDLPLSASANLFFPELQSFHRITLKTLGIRQDKLALKTQYPILFYPLYSLELIVKSLFKTTNKKSNTEAGNENIDAAINTLAKIYEFCRERQLSLALILVNAARGPEYAGYLEKQLSLRLPQLQLSHETKWEDVYETYIRNR